MPAEPMYTFTQDKLDRIIASRVARLNAQLCEAHDLIVELQAQLSGAVEQLNAARS